MNLKKQFIIGLVVTLLTLVSVTSFAQNGSYDLVILNGQVMDPESGLNAQRNIGMKDGKIVVITNDKIAGKQSIDAKGLVVAPGFIDTHSHALTPFGRKLQLRDGVTTPLELEGGVYPVDLWYNSMHGKSQTNYGATVSMMGVRESTFNPKYKTIHGAVMNDMDIAHRTHVTMKWSSTIPNANQIKTILGKVDEGLKQGALGVGNTAGYMVDGFTSQEAYGIQALAGKYGRFVSMHGRFSSQEPPTTGVLSIEEQLAAAAATGGGLIVVHMTAQTLALTPLALKIIDKAAAAGLHVIPEIYPYTYGATIVGADYLKPPNYQKNMGHDYKDIIEVATMKPLTQERYNELIKTNPEASVMFYNATKKDLITALTHPTSIIGSDAFPYLIAKTGKIAYKWDTPYDAVNGHPRGAGTHARFLKMVHQEKLMPLMLAISKMTYMPAKFMQDNGVAQMANKGRIKVGADADITIFDPKTVRENATMKHGGLPSTGIPYVIVNGIIVVNDSKVLKGVYPGKAVRLQ